MLHIDSRACRHQARQGTLRGGRCGAEEYSPVARELRVVARALDGGGELYGFDLAGVVPADAPDRRKAVRIVTH